MLNVPGIVFSGALELLATVEQYAHEDLLPEAVLQEAQRFRATVEEHVEIVREDPC